MEATELAPKCGLGETRMPGTRPVTPGCQERTAEVPHVGARPPLSSAALNVVVAGNIDSREVSLRLIHVTFATSFWARMVTSVGEARVLQTYEGAQGRGMWVVPPGTAGHQCFL